MKRLLSFLIAVVAAACFGGSLYAIYFIWSVKKPVIDKTTMAFGKAEDILDVAQKTIDDVKGHLEASRLQVQIVNASTYRDKQKQPGFMEAMLARSVAKQISPNINDVQHTVEKVTEASIVVNSILESLHGLEGIEQFDTNQIHSLQTQLGGVTKASWELGAILDSSQPGDNDSASEKSTRIAAGLDEVIHQVGEFQRNTGKLQMKVQRYKNDTLYWMNLTPTLATIALTWIAFTQLIVISSMVRALRRVVPSPG